MIGKSVNKSLLASVFIALAAPTATMAAPTAIVHAVFITDDAMREIAAKKVRVKPKSAPEKPDDPSYLKGTNIPKRITAPPPGSSILVPSSPDGNRVVLANPDHRTSCRPSIGTALVPFQPERDHGHSEGRGGEKTPPPPACGRRG